MVPGTPPVSATARSDPTTRVRSGAGPIHVGVLMAHASAEPAPSPDPGAATPRASVPPPGARPMGRAALALRAECIVPVFVSRVSEGRVAGFVARDPSRWEPISDAPMVAIYDRFPARVSPTRYDALVHALGHLPMGNPRAFMELAQDKVATHAYLTGLGLPNPEIEIEPARFTERIAGWGAGFLKPRYGTAGRGVVRVIAGEPLPPRDQGSDPAIDGPLFAQRAIEPLAPWRGVCVRVVVQRSPDRSWHRCPAVVRYSADDPVVNAARGSRVALAGEFLPASIMDRIRAGTDRLCRALDREPDGAWLLEVGLDWVVAQDGAPWLVELNSRPQGRLQLLAEERPDEFLRVHVDACARPLRFLAARAQAAAVEEERGEGEEERQPAADR